MIDQTDHVITKIMDDMHSRLKSGRGIKPLGFRDNAKPSLDYSQGTPVKIKPPQEATRRLNLDGTPKR